MVEDIAASAPKNKTKKKQTKNNVTLNFSYFEYFQSFLFIRFILRLC